MLCEWNS